MENQTKLAANYDKKLLQRKKIIEASYKSNSKTKELLENESVDAINTSSVGSPKNSTNEASNESRTSDLTDNVDVNTVISDQNIQMYKGTSRNITTNSLCLVTNDVLSYDDNHENLQ